MHNIAVINGNAAMAYHGAPPWHDLGQELTGEEIMSIQESLRIANLDWTVRKEDVFLKGLTSVEQAEPEDIYTSQIGNLVPGIKAVVRDIDNQILGTVGERYKLVQNSEAFLPLQHAIDEFGARVETAGALGVGDRVWMLLKINPEDLITQGVEVQSTQALRNGLTEVVPGDVIEPYFLVTNAHTRERSQSFMGMFTPVRVVCQNTLDMAEASGITRVSFRHTASVTERVAQIGNILTSTMEQYFRTLQMYRDLQSIPMTDARFFSLVTELWPLPTIDQLQELLAIGKTEEDFKPSERLAREHSTYLFNHGHGTELTGKTYWSAYNAITEYVDHVSVLRQDGKMKKNGAMSALFGQGAMVKREALRILTNWARQVID